MQALVLRLCFCCLLILGSPSAFAESENEDTASPHYKWFFTLHGGPNVDADLWSTLGFQWEDTRGTYIVVAALAREFWRYKQQISFEVEGQVGKFFGNEQQLQFNGLLIGRWNKFPWDKHIETSFAIGDGFSYITKVSDIEIEDNPDATKWLNYLLVELTLGLP